MRVIILSVLLATSACQLTLWHETPKGTFTVYQGKFADGFCIDASLAGASGSIGHCAPAEEEPLPE